MLRSINTIVKVWVNYLLINLPQHCTEINLPIVVKCMCSILQIKNHTLNQFVYNSIHICFIWNLIPFEMEYQNLHTTVLHFDFTKNSQYKGITIRHAPAHSRRKSWRQVIGAKKKKLIVEGPMWLICKNIDRNILLNSIW